MEVSEERPIAEKSRIGNLWRVIHKGKTMIMNQEKLEIYLKNYETERQSKGLLEV